MFLTEELTENIKVKNKTFSVRTDFRTWIDVERILMDDNVPSNFKLFVMYNNLDLFYEDDSIFDEPMDAVFDGILSFWRMNKNNVHSSNKKSNDIAYDYDEDFDLICAAFKQQYNINLRNVEMHWFEYKSLFDGLTKETQFVKIVGYRTINLNEVPKEQKKHYRELKEMYAIKDRLQEKEVKKKLKLNY